MSHTNQTRKERGNALFLILIAVALFAALSYAVTQSGRGGGTVDRETAMVAAGQVTQYAAGMRTAITRMIITGTAAASVSYQTDMTAAPCVANPSYCVFSPSGGGSVNQTPPSGAGTGTAWGYIDVTHATDGIWIYNVGTDASPSGRESLAYLTGVSLTVCSQIQKGLGASTTPPTQPTTIDWVPAAGAANPIVAVAANVLKAAGITGVAFACFNNNGTGYAYYHAMIEQ